MTVFEIFSSGTELASFVTSSHVLRRSWTVISCCHEDIGSNNGEGISWTVYKDPDSDLTIIAFEATLDTSNLEADLVSSDALRENNFYHFEFLCTDTNPIFSVNSTAISLLSKNYHRLDQLKSEINSFTPLIVTGYGLGGSVASLFTVSLLESIGSGKNRPLCITYGSPLIGDKKLQQAISSSSYWNSCFLHGVSLKDPIPRLFITNHSSSAAALTPQTSSYMPFGTFFLCSDANYTCFENPDTILELLMATGPIQIQNQEFQYADYGDIVENLNHKAIYKDHTTLVENMTCPESNSILARSISLQFRTLGLTPHTQQQQPNIDTTILEAKIIKQETEFIFQRKVLFNPFKKLNQIIVYMATLEWYKKHTRNQGIGYYDSYKSMESESDRDVDVFLRNLINYWEKVVEEANIKHQRGTATFLKRWLYAGTRYMRVVEPLAIAQYYRQGGKDYMTNRPKHFMLLEEWFRNETPPKAKTSNVEAILTLENPYFLACVEMALESCQQSTVGEEMEDYLNIISDEENNEAISTMNYSFWERVEQLLLSSKELNVVEENLNTTCKNNEDDNSYFEACVNVSLLSRQGSVVVEEEEENIKGFGLRVEEALLSRQESITIKGEEQNLDSARKKNVEDIVTVDSCFWAHVEEARISCKELKVIEEKEDTLQKLVEFEEYAYGLLNNYEVSPDIFLPQSSYMCWWNEYNAIKGTSYNSKLARFMNNVGKHNQYDFGDYDLL